MTAGGWQDWEWDESLFAGAAPYYVRGIRNSSPDGEDAVFVDAGFELAREVVVPDGHVLDRTADDLVAMRFSSSPTAPHLFGDRVGEFESDLRQLLADASPSGIFAVRLPDNVIRVWRPRV